MKLRFWAVLAMGVAAYLALPLPGLSKPLNQRIDQTRSKVNKKKRVEGVLTTTISRYNNKIAGLQGDIRGLQGRQRKIQGTLDEKRTDLLDARDKLEKARDRLVGLRSELAKGQRVLSKRLVAIYKSNEPDALTVVLQADGFAELLDRADFLHRVSDQDQRIITKVRSLKKTAARQEKQLAGLEGKIQNAADIILARRNELASSKNRLVRSRFAIEDVRSGRKATLSKVRESRHAAEEDLRALNRESAKVQARLQGSAGAPGGGPIKKGTGRFIWPVNGPITSPFCEKRAWESCHPGVDIGVGSGTPIHAADSGRVAIAGPTGGYGNYTCINHTSSISTCYAHQSAFKVSVGQSVSQGQVIGLSGCTGLCFGDHLHFEVRVNGSVVNPLNYL